MPFNMPINVSLCICFYPVRRLDNENLKSVMNHIIARACAANLRLHLNLKHNVDLATDFVELHLHPELNK
jgi:ABC-type phosphate/phosphonate transport system ATPase subunit